MREKTFLKSVGAIVLSSVLCVVFAAQASAKATTFRGESQFNLFVSCLNGGAGDTLVGTVSDHITVVENGNGAGAQISIVHFVSQGDLVSQTTGEVFRINDNFSFRDLSTPGGTTLFSIGDRLTLVGPEGAALVDPFHLQITQNANGDVTATVIHDQRPICE